MRNKLINSLLMSLCFSSAAIADDLTPFASPPPEELAKLQALNQQLNYKGWDIPFPSWADSVLLDADGFRSKLATYGFGFSAFNAQIGSINLLNAPNKTNNIFAQTPNTPARGSIDQQYYGQSPSVADSLSMYLTYDTSRWGVPDGQIAIAGAYEVTRDQPLLTEDRVALRGLSWYQTAFNKALEIKVGYIGSDEEFVGFNIAGNIANPFGPQAIVPQIMGFISAPGSQPTARVTWHIDDRFYDQVAVARSLQICTNPRTCSGNTSYQDGFSNPTDFAFHVHNGDALFINEFGYKHEATPGDPKQWLRFGWINNQSEFANLKVGGVDRGVNATYLLYDQQVTQLAPESPLTAYRGIYVGGSYYYVPPEYSGFSANVEGRIYAIGLFDSRPFDQIALSYDHNFISKYAANIFNSGQLALSCGGFAPCNTQAQQVYAPLGTNTLTLTYTAHIMRGVFATAGLSYTDNPSVPLVKGEGHDLAFTFATFVNF